LVGQAAAQGYEYVTEGPITFVFTVTTMNETGAPKETGNDDKETLSVTRTTRTSKITNKEILADLGYASYKNAKLMVRMEDVETYYFFVRYSAGAETIDDDVSMEAGIYGMVNVGLAYKRAWDTNKGTSSEQTSVTGLTMIDINYSSDNLSLELVGSAAYSYTELLSNSETKGNTESKSLTVNATVSGYESEQSFIKGTVTFTAKTVKKAL
jgi:hypothetical protein